MPMFDPSGLPIIGAAVSERPLSRRDLVMFSWLHEWAVKNDVSVICKGCNGSITGRNSGHEQDPAISCQCTEWRYRGGA